MGRGAVERLNVSVCTHTETFNHIQPLCMLGHIPKGYAKP